MKITIADDRSQNPPPIPITPYSAAEPPPKNLANPMAMPNSPPMKNTHTKDVEQSLVHEASARSEGLTASVHQIETGGYRSRPNDMQISCVGLPKPRTPRELPLPLH